MEYISRYQAKAHMHNIIDALLYTDNIEAIPGHIETYVKGLQQAANKVGVETVAEFIEQQQKSFESRNNVHSIDSHLDINRVVAVK
ncbi:hypothetical protein [Alicyclobacillus dauci]|uniref:Uncharacterized protein n=1 Tax=Alicyclobacillus dauci TaxID=1475485 RepID=A0ABY6YX39_9BACL|nr:hypothetical protein [Alicyclobacillus dauci]WAH35005.1 hypothetical protein NZD86_11755 [Alicyclobacillus dauci]